MINVNIAQEYTMDQLAQNQNEDPNLESLENESVNAGAAAPQSPIEQNTVHTEQLQPVGAAAKTSPRSRLFSKERLKHVNMYLVVFCGLFVVSGAIIGYLYLNSKQSKQSGDSLSSQSLSASSLNQLANSGVSVGDPKQVLNVQSNSIFSGKVLIRQDLEVAGRLLVGSSLSLAGITVSGQSTFDDVQVTKDLSVSGNTGIQGKLTTRNLATSGDGNFGGTVTAGQLVANTLQLNSNLTLTHHLIAGGATPSRSNGGALGSGGTSTVSGSDTSGSVTINTGGSPSAGCMITVNFAQKFNANPHVIITPVGSAAANIGYYVTRSTSGFSICDTSGAPGGQSFGFDYLAIE